MQAFLRQILEKNSEMCYNNSKTRNLTGRECGKRNVMLGMGAPPRRCVIIYLYIHMAYM